MAVAFIIIFLLHILTGLVVLFGVGYVILTVLLYIIDKKENKNVQKNS